MYVILAISDQYATFFLFLICFTKCPNSRVEIRAQRNVDHWIAGSNPLRGMFHRYFHLIVPCACLAQFSLNNVQNKA